MKYGFSSYNSYDPLKSVLIGHAYPVDFFADHPDTKVADALCKVNDETREDLNNMQAMLEERGIRVHRMTDQCIGDGRTWNSVKEVMDAKGFIPRPLMAPRDEYMVLGKNLIACTPKSCWYMPKEFYECEDTLTPSQDYKYTNRPQWGWPHEDDNSEPNPWWFGNFGNERIKSVEARITGPSVVRTGRDLLVDVDRSIPDSAFLFATKWIKKYNEEFGENFRAHRCEFGRHSDGLMNILRPGLVISSAGMENYELTYPGWDVAYIRKPNNEYIRKFTELKYNSRFEKDSLRMMRYWVAGEEGNQALHEFIDLWFNENVGHCFETNFDVNVLSLDHNTVVSSGKNSEAEAELKRFGIETIVAPIRHRWFWDGGVHCCTVDLIREGDCEDYFPERGDSSIVFKDLINYEVQDQDNQRGMSS
ncbi:MAG: hypothetical protein CBE00_08445 [Planctomycetaceae bacterium TMED240]|nr:MAG: hypothetical protein CBE00_08445 [Planctomycetaceae bacterium TMED240]